jgi:hypothetical protein
MASTLRIGIIIIIISEEDTACVRRASDSYYNYLD